VCSRRGWAIAEKPAECHSYERDHRSNNDSASAKHGRVDERQTVEYPGDTLVELRPEGARGEAGGARSFAGPSRSPSRSWPTMRCSQRNVALRRYSASQRRPVHPGSHRIWRIRLPTIAAR
jgi:hypothetical protein